MKLPCRLLIGLFSCCSLLIAAAPVLGQQPLRCSAKTSYLSEAQVTHTETEQYVRYEFSYRRNDHFWSGVIFEFYDVESDNPLLKGLQVPDVEDAVSEKLAGNLRQLMVDSLIYQDVSEPQRHALDQGIIMTFEGHYEGDKDLYAVHGKWNRGQLQFFRTHATSDGDGSKHLESSVAADSLSEIIKSCRFNEA